MPAPATPCRTQLESCYRYGPPPDAPGSPQAVVFMWDRLTAYSTPCPCPRPAPKSMLSAHSGKSISGLRLPCFS